MAGKPQARLPATPQQRHEGPRQPMQSRRVPASLGDQLQHLTIDQFQSSLWQLFTQAMEFSHDLESPAPTGHSWVRGSFPASPCHRSPVARLL